MNNRTEKSSCRRCGTCCKKGGPAFHLADRAIIEKGAIQLKHLTTIREGEPAWDNVSGGVLPAPTDIIKIKSRPGGRTCVFYDEEAAACTRLHPPGRRMPGPRLPGHPGNRVPLR